MKNLIHFIKTNGLVFLILFVTGCAYIYGDKEIITNRDTDYLKAKSIPPLKIPPNLSSSTIHTQYPISEKEYPENSKKPDLTPPGLY